MAATKCRQRKLERIQELETMVLMERQKGTNLQVDIELLKKTIVNLNVQLVARQDEINAIREAAQTHQQSLTSENSGEKLG